MSGLHVHQHQKERDKAFLHKNVAVAFSVESNDVVVPLLTGKLNRVK